MRLGTYSPSYDADFPQNELSVITVLDVCSEQSFYILFGIVGYLLKFVYGNNTRFVGFCEVLENLFERRH